MKTKLVHPCKSLGYTDIYVQFVAGENPPQYLYPGGNIESVVKRLDTVRYDRDKMAVFLRRQNADFGASARTFENIDKLTDPRTVCVFAGQQAGLLGGPMFSLLKGLAVVKAARLYSQQLDRPVIPIFWIAGDDHDFEEVNHVYLLNRKNEPCRTQYATPPSMEVPVGEIKFSDAGALKEAIEHIKQCLGETDFTPDLYDLIERAYTPEDTFVSAFGKMMAGLTAEQGLVFFSPGDTEVKRHAAPFFKNIISRQQELHEIISATNREITGLGYHIQVAKKDNATHLFYNLDGRKPVLQEGDSFIVGDTSFTRDELLARLDDHPERFSPDVMTRPVFQSYLFPTVSQKGGPSEIAYLAQVNPIFRLFGLPAPYHRARASVTVVEKRIEDLMTEYGVSFEDVTGDIEQVINRVLLKTFPDDLESEFAKLRKDVENRFDCFSKTSLAFDPSLKAFATQTYGKIDFNLKAFEGKVFSAHKKQSQQTRERIYKVWNAIYPLRGFQERALNASYFVSKYGYDFVSFLFETMDSEEQAHQLIYLSEMHE